MLNKKVTKHKKKKKKKKNLIFMSKKLHKIVIIMYRGDLNQLWGSIGSTLIYLIVIKASLVELSNK